MSTVSGAMSEAESYADVPMNMGEEVEAPLCYIAGPAILGRSQPI